MAVDLTPKGAISNLRLRDDDVKANIAEAVIGAPTIDLSSDSVSELSFSVSDPGLSLLRSGIFDLRTRLTYLELSFEIAAVEVGGGHVPVLGITARARAVQRLRRKRGALVRRNMSPTTFVELLARDVGLKVIGEPSPKRKQVARTDPKGERPESSWDAIQRLASELGYWAFEAAGTLYFARPRWLVKRSRDITVRYPEATSRDELDTVSVPNCRRSADSSEAVTIELELPPDRAGKIRPGQVLELDGVPGFKSDYIVTGVSFTLDSGSPVTVSAATPIDPEPQPPETKGPGSGSESGGGTGDDSSGGASAQGLIWPVSGPVTSGYGPRAGGTHYGIDIGVPTGTRCKAAKGGSVTVASVDSDGYGQWVELDHGGGLRTRYAHFNRTSVRVGQRVEQGAVIGYCDSTGNARGSHLHFEVRVGGSPRDPIGYLP